MPPLVVMGGMMAMMAAGTAISAISSVRQGQVSGDTAMLNARLQAREMASKARQAERQSERDAQFLERDAQSADYAAEEVRQATQFEVGRQQVQARALQAQQRAQIGASGLEATGSPLLVMAETARQLELDRMAITHGGEVKARQAEDEARLTRYRAGAVREEGQLTAGELRKGIPLTLGLGRYQARAATQAGEIGVYRSILGGASAGASTAYRLYG